jgi:tripartite-type tricarboxylate transporter receptor subunit TctC
LAVVIALGYRPGEDLDLAVIETEAAIDGLVAERMRASLGQPIIIENVGGADGSIGAGRAVRARPDGYTIDIGFLGNHALNGAFYSLPYDVLKDFGPISPLVTFSNVLFARKTVPAKNLNELIAWLKANPNKASAAVTAVGPRLINASFQKETGTQFTLVPYRGNAPAVQDLAAGQIDLWFGGPEQLPLMRAGGIKAYAVTSDKRLAVASDIPTFAELGLPTLSFSSWFGLFAPKGTPKDIISKLNAAVVVALADPAAQSRVVDLGYEVFSRERQTPEALDDTEGRCQEVVADHQRVRDQGGVNRGQSLPTRSGWSCPVRPEADLGRIVKST